MLTQISCHLSTLRSVLWRVKLAAALCLSCFSSNINAPHSGKQIRLGNLLKYLRRGLSFYHAVCCTRRKGKDVIASQCSVPVNAVCRCHLFRSSAAADVTLRGDRALHVVFRQMASDSLQFRRKEGRRKFKVEMGCLYDFHNIIFYWFVLSNPRVSSV